MKAPSCPESTAAVWGLSRRQPAVKPRRRSGSRGRLLLAGVGLYGVMATSVAQRTREVGVRMALGAQAGDVLRMILRQGMIQIAIGVVLGLGLAAAVGNLLALALYDVNPRDPVVFGSIITFLSAAALFACFVPARRATRVDPNIALRAE